MRNKIQALSNAVTSKAGRKVLQIQKNSPTLMFGAGVIGVVTTVVLASKATLKLDELMDDHENVVEMIHVAREEHPEKYSEKDVKNDITKNYIATGLKITKLYGPAFTVGAISIGCLTGAHVTLNRRNAGLIAAYATMEKGFKEYRERVLADQGADKDREYRYGTQEKEILSETKKGEPKVTRTKVVGEGAGSSIYSRFFEPSNENWNPTAENNLFFIKLHQNNLNDRLQAKGHVFLNEAYDALSLPRTPEGQIVGWVKDSNVGDGYIDFGIWDDERMEAMHSFVTGFEDHILLDFNVDGVVYDLI